MGTHTHLGALEQLANARNAPVHNGGSCESVAYYVSERLRLLGQFSIGIKVIDAAQKIGRAALVGIGNNYEPSRGGGIRMGRRECLSIESTTPVIWALVNKRAVLIKLD